ncbi:MAG: hypothetical protein ACXADW_10925 [Candidatus Hodarchaeales archaeon]
MRPHTIRFLVIPIILLSVFLPLNGTSKALKFSMHQESFEISELLPQSSETIAQSLSKPLIQQAEVGSYLNSAWDETELISFGLSEAIEIICQARIKSASMTDSRNSDLLKLNSEVEISFNQILNTELASPTEYLNKTPTGLFYTWNTSVGNISTAMNLWIAKALLINTPTDDSSAYIQAKGIINGLNLTNREALPPFYYREYVLIDSDETVIPDSLSSFALLKDQILAMQVILQLSHGSTNPTLAENLQIQVKNWELSILNPTDGYADVSTEIWNKDLSVGFFHTKRNQKLGGTFFINNQSTIFFFDHILLLRYILQQLEKQFEPLSISFYEEIALKLISDISITFKAESLYSQGLEVTNLSSDSWFLDSQLVNEQFEFIDLINGYSEWFSINSEDLIINEQLKRLILPLWIELSSSAYISIDKIAGIGSSNQASKVGNFYAYYSSSLGYYLFGNSSTTSLLVANMIAVYALGNIFPFQVVVDYTDFLTRRSNQTLNISIVPLTLGIGTFINIDVIVDIPTESISKITATQLNINSQSTVTIPYSYQITQEGNAVFTISLNYQGQTFVTVQGKYTTLRIMSLNANFTPSSPEKGERLKINLEARDSVGILRLNVYYFAYIHSETLEDPLWVFNQSLFQINGNASTIDLLPSQTTSDLSCYFLIQKSGYYPAELNLTISMQTPLNFLFDWIFWLMFESEIGGYLGTLSAIFALMWGFHTQIVRRATRRIKSCPHCGGIYHTKYLVCSHCGRDIEQISREDTSDTV